MPQISNIFSFIKKHQTNNSNTTNFTNQKYPDTFYLIYPDTTLSYKIALCVTLSGCPKNPTGLGASLSTGHVHGDVYTQTISMKYIF